MKPGLTGFSRLIAATANSARGIRDALRHEAAFRQELLLVALLLPASVPLAGNLLEWLMLVTPLFILLIVELLNSAVENAIDRIGPEHHELSGRAKDMGSAAVLFSLLLIALVWGTFAWRYLYG